MVFISTICLSLISLWVFISTLSTICYLFDVCAGRLAALLDADLLQVNRVLVNNQLGDGDPIQPDDVGSSSNF
jgi:hypothetical protein